MAINLTALKDHIGRTMTEQDLVVIAPLEGMAVTLDRALGPFEDGSEIPPGWHGVFFTAKTPRDQLGQDGLPLDTGVIPPMPYPRRMFAGARVTWHQPIRAGERLSRETELMDINARSGSTGDLIFTTVQRRITGPAGLAIVEEWDSVFREEVKPGAKSGIPKRATAPEDTIWARTKHPDPVTLFRFSALTFNPHRIHYDKPYAMNIEGYPGLVVHGPLLQQYMIDLAVDHHPGHRIAGFDMRARAPLFDDQPFQIVGRPIDQMSCEIWAVTPGGTIAMSATATFV